MKIEHNNLVAKVAANIRYEDALGRVSVLAHLERRLLIEVKRDQTIAVVSNRTDAILRGLSDAEMSEIVHAAFDRVDAEYFKQKEMRARFRAKH